MGSLKGVGMKLADRQHIGPQGELWNDRELEAFRKEVAKAEAEKK